MPHLAVIEFPLAALAALVALRIAAKPARKARKTRKEGIAPGRKHVQVVRELPDPEVEAVRAPLEAWVERGERREEAVQVLSRALERDDRGKSAGIEAALRPTSSRSKREAALKSLLNEFKSQGV